MSKALKKIVVKVNLPTTLIDALEPLLIQRNLTLDEVVRLYLGALITSAKRSAPLGLQSAMPFGKFQGEELGVIIRAHPDYVSWLLGNSDSFKLAPEALALLEKVQESIT